MAVNHPIVDVVQNPEKVNTDISFTPLSQRTIVLDVDQTFRAGATRHHYNNWLNLTSDKFILETITGARLEFEEPPNQICSPRSLKFSDQEFDIIDSQIKEFLQLGIVEKAIHVEQEFLSNVFSRHKRNGSSRLILNLVKLNPFIQYHHFKMDTIEAVINLMRLDCFRASIDLTNAYFSIPIAEEHRCFLRFVWMDELYQFTALPNGLSSGPRIFTKVLKPVYAHLRQLGPITCGYIDDSYIMGDTYDTCLTSIRATHDLFKSLGFFVNYDKSVLVPTRQIEHLGFLLNSANMTVSLTSSKKANLISKCRVVLQDPAPSIRAVAELIGIFVSSFTAVEFGRLHYRQLESEKVQALKRVAGDYDKTFYLSEDAKTEIQWWIDNINSQIRHIEHGKISFLLTTDASNQGWGAVFDAVPSEGAQQCTGGRWTLEEKLQHINGLELKAGFLGLQSLCSNLSNVHIKMYLDNTCSVAYLNHQGGMRSVYCDKLANSIWEFCQQRNLWITAAHLPGQLNTLADEKSRIFDDKTEWKLNAQVFQQIVGKFVTPEIDLFASRLNYQFNPYVSWFPDPGAKFIDAFTLNWADAVFYAFPPFSIVTQVLRKIEFDGAKGILVVPNWPTQVWFPLLRRLLLAPPMTLRWHQDLVTLPFRQGPHPLGNKLKLMACYLSGAR